ncbi:hypothetical protein [Actinomadura sp. 3N508]|uniref:hypothetical protein n=1 Tax=Actinomadura sp. 3N508 TaxID=3375153 RepID=UPI0037BB2EE5
MRHQQHEEQEPDRRTRRIIDAVAAALPSGPSALRRALSPLRLAAAAIRAAARLARRIPPDRPPHAARTAAARNQRSARWYRAWYLVNAARRFHTAITTRPRRQSVADAVRQAMPTELRYLRQHLAAQANRRRTATEVDRLAAIYGDRLGWSTVHDGSTTADCRHAHRQDFLVSNPPRMGLPGAVHPRCRCRPVRPWGTRLLT